MSFFSFESCTLMHLPDLTFQINTSQTFPSAVSYCYFPRERAMLSQATRVAVLGFCELYCDWLRILTSRKSFSGSSLQTLVFGGDKQQPEICLRSQAMASLTQCFVPAKGQ